MFIRTVSALFGAALLATTVQAATVEEFKAEDWDGLAFTSDATGNFTHCSVYATYKNGSTLYISYEAEDSWYFSVANDTWKLDEGGSYPIKFKVDGRGEIEGTASSLGPTQIGLPVETDHPFVGQLRRGNRLVITLQDEDYAFELSNSSKAMNAARDCVRRHVKLGTHTPVVAKTDEPPKQESQQTSVTPSEAATPEETTTADNSTSDGAATDDSTTDSTTADSGAAPSDADKPAQASGEQQQFGSWVVTATNDDSGNFVNCTAYDVQGDDQLILSYFPDKGWTFGLYRPAWTLDTNQTYYLWYNVDAPADAKDVVKRPVEAAEPTRIFFEVSDVEDIIDRIENGTTLNLQVRAITGPAETFSYTIEQAHEAFEAARKCVDDHATQTTSEAPATDDQSTASDDSTGDQDTDASGESADSGSGTDQQGTTETTEAANAAPPLPTLGSRKLEDLQVAGWVAAAFGQDDGSFSHCAIKAEYQNGATLGVALTAAGEIVLAVKDGEWSLTEGSWVPLSFTLKTDTPYSSATGQAQAVDATTLMADIGSKEDLGATVGGASEVTVSAEGKDLSFDTSDIGPAYAAIDQCVSDHASQPASTPAPAPAGKVNPDTAPGDSTSDGGATASPASNDKSNQEVATADDAVTTAEADPATLRTEAAGYSTALLIRSGYPNHVILGADATAPDEVPPGDAMWELGAVLGSTRIVSSGTPSDIERDVVASMTDKCGGALATWPVTSDATHSQFTLVCESAWTIQVVVVPRDGGGSYVFAMNGKGDDIAEEVTATALYTRALGG